MKRNWRKYNKDLENRGNITIWFSPKAIKAWKAPKTNKFGRPFSFSDAAITTLLMLKFTYRLGFRQVSGFVKSLVSIMGLKIQVPHFTSICKRMKTLEIPKHILSKRGITDIVFDTTGLRVYASGEWKKKKYGGKRTWKKIHVGMNLQTGEIFFSKATHKDTHDLKHVKDALAGGNRKHGQFLIDGIGDDFKLYDDTKKRNKDLLSPPRKGANPYNGPYARRQAVTFIQFLGGDEEAKTIWSKLTGYNKRSRVESGFSVWKRMFGEELASRTTASIDSEIYLKPLIFNKMIKMGCS